MKLNAIQNHSHLAHFLLEMYHTPSAVLSNENVAINLVIYLPFTEL